MIPSKNFTPEEIKGYLMIDGRQVVYLKEHVKRLKRYPETLNSENPSQINYNILALKQYMEYLKKVVGLDDFENT